MDQILWSGLRMVHKPLDTIALLFHQENWSRTLTERWMMKTLRSSRRHGVDGPFYRRSLEDVFFFSHTNNDLVFLGILPGSEAARHLPGGTLCMRNVLQKSISRKARRFHETSGWGRKKKDRTARAEITYERIIGIEYAL